MKKIFKYFVTGLAAFLFLLALYILVFGSMARKNNELLSIFGYSYSVVATPSMDGNKSDSFGAGAIIITKEVDFSDLEIGDIIVFQGEGRLIVHRIIAQNLDGSFDTKGDANPIKDDNPVTDDLYQAKVIQIFKALKISSKLPNYQIQILLVLIILLVIFALYQVFVIFKVGREEKITKIKKQNEAEIENLRKEILEEIKEKQEKK